MVEDVQPDKTADKLAVIRLLKFSVYGFSTHSCNPQRMIFTHSRAAHQAQSADSLSLFVIDKR